MKTIVSVSPSLDISRLAAFFPGHLQDANDTLQLCELDSSQVEHLAQLLEQAEQEAVILCYSRAEHFIAAKLSAGLSLSAAADEWLGLTARLTDLHKKNRQRFFLLNADLWLQYPQQWPERFRQLDLEPLGLNPLLPAVDLPLLTACQFVQQHTELQQLNQLLIASSFPLTDDDVQLNLPLEHVLHQHFITQQQQQLLHDNQALLQLQLQQATTARQHAEQDKANTIRRLEQLQQQSTQQLATLTIQLQDKSRQQLELEQQHSALRAQLSELQSQLQDKAQQHAALKTDQEQMLAQLQLVQQQLEQQAAEKATTEQACLKAQQAVTQLEGELAGHTNEQQRLAEELANAKAQLAAKVKPENTAEAVPATKALAELEQENALVLEQLFKVQEQLEDYYLQLQQQKILTATAQAQGARSLQSRLQSAINLLISVAKDPGFIPAEALQARAILIGSDLFDPHWYQQQYLAAESDPMDAVEHYLTQGAAAGFSPGPRFDGPAYLQTHQDVAAAGLNPLVHFEQYGRAEGRRISALPE